MSHHHAKLPAWYTLIGFSLFHQLIDQHCHVGQPPRASKKMGKLPPFTFTDSNSRWLERGSIFSFLFFFTTEISYLIIGLWHLLEPIPLWRENSLCAAQLKPLQFVNLSLPVPGPPGGKPDVQWVTQIPRTLEDRPQGEGEQSHAALFNKHQNKEWMQPWHFTMVIWYVDTSVVFSDCARGIFVHMNPCSSDPLGEGAVELIVYSHPTKRRDKPWNL